jgi:hypothetical protein
MTLVVGGRLPAGRLTEALAAENRPVRTWNSVAAPPEDGSSRGLGAELVALERALADDPPERVLLADASDAALAAALVASKLLVPVEAVEDAAGAEDVNARLISQLAETYTPGR